jgi:hypothetical protein
VFVVLELKKWDSSQGKLWCVWYVYIHIYIYTHVICKQKKFENIKQIIEILVSKGSLRGLSFQGVGGICHP